MFTFKVDIDDNKYGSITGRIFDEEGSRYLKVSDFQIVANGLGTNLPLEQIEEGETLFNFARRVCSAPLLVNQEEIDCHNHIIECVEKELSLSFHDDTVAFRLSEKVLEQIDNRNANFAVQLSQYNQ